MIDTYITVRVDEGKNLNKAFADVPKLAKRTGYTELEVTTYLECARLAGSRIMYLPIKRDLNLSKI